MNHDDLESWSIRAAQALQEFCDDAQEAAGDPDGEDELRDIRALLSEHSRIMLGQPVWQSLVQATESEGDSVLNI